MNKIRLHKALWVTLMLAIAQPSSHLATASASPHPANKALATDDIEVKRNELTTLLYALANEMDKLQKTLDDKVTLTEDASELYNMLRDVEIALQDCHVQIMKATTSTELEKCKDYLYYISSVLEKLEQDIEDYTPSTAPTEFTAPLANGIEMTFKVVSEKNKTCQVGNGEKCAVDKSTKGDIVIPTTVNGYKVVAIANQAFYFCEEITSIDIPEGITSIGEWVFEFCGLTSLHIPASVTSLANEFFGLHSKVTSLTVAEGNRVYSSPAGSNAILSNGGKTLVAACSTTVIPEGVEWIGFRAFDGSHLKYIDFADGVGRFDAEVFARSDVKFIVIGGIKEFNPSSNAFYLSTMDAVYLRQDDGTLSMLCNGYVYSQGFYPYNKPIGTDYTIPAEVVTDRRTYKLTTLGKYAFNNCKTLEKLTIPATITAIEGKYAFLGCNSLRTITSYIPQPFAIDEEAFGDDVYANATLYVPAGTKTLYASTDGWKNFKNIVQMEDADRITDIVNSHVGTDGAVYNLNGQKVRLVSKGIYIRNGKKVLVR